VVSPENAVTPAELRACSWKVQLFGARSGSRLGGTMHRCDPPWVVPMHSTEGDSILLVPINTGPSSGTLGAAGDSGAFVFTTGGASDGSTGSLSSSRLVGLQSAIGSMDGRQATLVSPAASWWAVRTSGGDGSSST
jgi:hypothetical protein